MELQELTGIGAAKEHRLNMVGVNTVSDLADATDEQLDDARVARSMRDRAMDYVDEQSKPDVFEAVQMLEPEPVELKPEYVTVTFLEMVGHPTVETLETRYGNFDKGKPQSILREHAEALRDKTQYKFKVGG